MNTEKTTENSHIMNQLQKFWVSYNAKVVLLLLITIFMAYAVFIAVNTKPGIIPDEPAHFTFSKHYSTTWGIPPDVTETYSLGWYIYRNPFLFYWINGRIINLSEFLIPNINQVQMLTVLRFLSVIYGLGTVLFCYFFSKELIKHKWLSLLPVFLLTNTLMFVFLVGGVSYDNLANLFSMAGLFFFVRVLQKKSFIANSFGWTISIFAGTLVKYPILPLALIMSIIWIIHIIKNKGEIFPIHFSLKRDLLLGSLLLVIAFGNLAIYGYNLLSYRSITPNCRDILSEEQCRLSPYVRRYEEIALEQKLSVSESINLGYPDPITYLIYSWIPNILFRIFGFAGHLAYWPNPIIISLFHLLLIWIVVLYVKYVSKPPLSIVSSLIVFLFFALVIFVMNYNNELVYGFKSITLQGRYFFPVIGVFFCIYAYLLSQIPNKLIFSGTLLFTIFLFIVSGPINIFIRYETFFYQWFLLR